MSLKQLIKPSVPKFPVPKDVPPPPQQKDPEDLMAFTSNEESLKRKQKAAQLGLTGFSVPNLGAPTA